jgi:hypothetical protein
MTSDPSAPQSSPTSPETKPAHKSHRWHEHVPRTTAALAVLAAVSSGQYTGQFSRTILSQAEVTDQWSYYQAKKIKLHLTQNQADLAHALGVGKPEVAAQLADFEQKNQALAKKYEADLATISASARSFEAEKDKHEQQGDRFQYAFIILQAGVVLSTVAASAKRRELWILAILCGVAGLLMVGDAYLLLDLKLRHPPAPTGISQGNMGG